jgi:hypothetical protein
VLELQIEDLELVYELLTGFDESVFRANLAVGLDADIEGTEQGVRHTIASEDDIGGAEELRAQHVREGVVLFVEMKHRAVRNTCLVWEVSIGGCRVWYAGREAE